MLLKMVLKMERAMEEDLDLVMDLVNTAYLVEKGSTGLAFKASDRFVSKEAAFEALPHLWLAKNEAAEVVGVLGVEEEEERVAELGPIAVVRKGQGIGNLMMDWVEARYG